MENINSNTVTRILRQKRVENLTGLPKSSMYAAIHEGVFPKPIQISKRSVGWIESEVIDFIQARIKESRNVVKGGV